MKVLLSLLRSMRFAIAILAVVGVASTIGSILEQNQPAVVYVSRYGEFWASFFTLCGLTDIYHAWWFYTLLTFMASSTALCLWQNAPSMVRDMRSYRENKSIASLRNLEFHTEFELRAHDASRAGLASYLTAQGFRYKHVNTSGGSLLAARAGGARRLGYLLVHGAMVLICVGGLVDGRISYRASMTIPEGETSSQGQIQDGDQIIQQPIPFAVRLKKFAIAHYANGQPKDFTSDIEIIDGAKVVPVTLQVNHPYTYRGVTLFQSGFADGGSKVTLRMDGAVTQQIGGVIGAGTPLLLNGAPATLEFAELRVINVFDKDGTAARNWNSRGQPGDRTRDVGPSVAFRLRDQQGQSDEWLVYQRAIEIDGARYRVVGHRAAGEDGMRYLRIPVDSDTGNDVAGTIAGYQHLVAALADPQQRARAARQTAERVTDPRLAATLSATAAALMEAFHHKGYRALTEMSRLRGNDEEALKAAQLYHQLLERSAALLAPELSPRMVHDVLNAYDDAVNMQLPALFTFETYDQVNATGLQVTHAPGAALVYLGSALLALGVIAMYFVRERRIWLYSAGGKLLLAFSANRNTPALRTEFDRHAGAIAQLAGAPTP
ncbi:cytochrome c biogenesis protein ResB [Duganella callida]|uniref:Cytochrome c biogenesis protein ResB n=1 Tax=Duganella callida TaxID=2561932 RepID=A0A4Y9SEI8_9BURK|nr:cytochrome c biogenesis protein ResB [Duganella callida]TFW21433.1 cytochrome c biogenesis protein ResB [Duganella callida]